MDINLALGALALLAIVVLGGTIVWRPPLPTLSPWLQLSLVAAGFWGIGELWALSSPSLASKRAALALMYAGSVFLPALWLVTVFRWVGLHSPLLLRIDPGWQRVPLIVAALSLLAVVTQPLHGMVLEPVVGGRNEYGPLFPWLLGAGYLEVAVAVALSLVVAREHPAREVRRAALLLATAPMLPLVANVLYVISDAYQPSNLTALVIAVGCAGGVAAVWRGRAFWLLPVALREVVERDISGILVLGPEGRPVYWNPAARELLGDLPPATDTALLPALAGRLRILDVVAGDGPAPLPELLAAAGATGVVCENLARPDQALRLCLQPLHRRGHVVAHSLRIEDVSRRVEAERARDALAAERIEDEKLRHLATVASDLADGFHDRLAAIVSAAFMASADEERGEPVVDHLHRIAGAADEALDLTQQLLAIGGRSAPDSRTTSALTLVEATIQQIEEDEHDTLAIASYVPMALPVLRADEQQVVQGLVAIARDARGRMESGAAQLTLTAEVSELGAVAVAAYVPRREPGHFVLISVMDEGRPLRDAERDRLLGLRAPEGASDAELELSAGVALLVANGASLAVGHGTRSGNLVRIAFPVETELRP